ncbi:MAG: glycosyltransferase family 2 protein [Planctomycetota bacterium]|jgi:GT2 family glycosyltransferase
MHKENTVSIVIPVYNDKENLEKCLESLYDIEEKDFDIVVVDDESDDDPESVTKKFLCRIIRLPVNRGQAYARNIGVKETKGDIILFTDSDCIVMKGWVKNITEELIKSYKKSEDVVAIYGRVTSNGNFFARCHDYTGYAYVQGGPRRSMDYLNTACVAIYREAFWKAGGFSENMKVREDPDLALKLIEKGYRVVFDPAVFVFHNHGIDTFKEFILKHKKWGKDLGLKLDLKHKGQFQGAWPLFFNPFTHALLIIPVALFTTIKIVSYNIRFDRKVLMYSFFIFLGKIFYRWGIFIQSVKKDEVKTNNG